MPAAKTPPSDHIRVPAFLDRIFTWFEARAEPFPPGEPERPPADLIGFLRHYAWPFRYLMLATSVCATLGAIIDVLMFSFLGSIIDWLGTADRANFWDTHGTSLILMAVLVLVINPIIRFSYETVFHQAIMGNFAMQVRWRAHRYVLRQSLDFFQNDFAGRLANKVMQTALGVRETVMTLAEVLLYALVYFITAIVLMAAADWRLMLPLLVWFIGYVLVLRYFVPRLAAVSKQQSEARSVVNGRIVDTYTNMPTVKMFAHAAREDDYALEGMQTMMGTVHRQMRQVTLLSMSLVALNAFMISSVTGLGIWLWSGELITAGAIALAVGLVLRIQGMSQWILWEVAGLFENIGVVQDGMEVIARDRTVTDVPSAAPLKVTAGTGAFERIRFSYGRTPEGDAVGVIQDLNLTLAPGEKVGLVGRSGAGKSTLVNLLLRFYDLESGRITIDGQDIAKVDQDTLRAQIGVVTQDTSLLHRSVLDNVIYGRADAGREAAIEAAKSAEAHEFILGLEDQKGRTGYDAHVGERGVKLSGGQRQRIAIARALLKDAPLLVLDEATSALDSEVEAAIQAQLYRLMEGKTVLAIAHRLSTIAAMDRLIVMDRGVIVRAMDAY
ncbi:MAG: ABC transporter ATP-binding protein, partial [Pseudomonadota bacterium]